MTQSAMKYYPPANVLLNLNMFLFVSRFCMELPMRPILTYHEFTVSEEEWREILGIPTGQVVDWNTLEIDFSEIYRFSSFWGSGVAFFGDVFCAIETLFNAQPEEHEAFARACSLFESKHNSRPPAIMDPRWLLYVFNP